MINIWCVYRSIMDLLRICFLSSLKKNDTESISVITMKYWKANKRVITSKGTSAKYTEDKKKEEKQRESGKMTLHEKQK